MYTGRRRRCLSSCLYAPTWPWTTRFVDATKDVSKYQGKQVIRETESLLLKDGHYTHTLLGEKGGKPPLCQTLGIKKERVCFLRVLPMENPLGWRR